MEYESIKSNDMRAIKIDVQKRDVYEIEMKGGDFRELYGVIGNNCTCFCAPIRFDNDDTMFSDDEILLRPNDIVGGFIMPDWSYPIYNNAVIIGADDEGESVSAKSDINELKNQITFI